MEIKHISYSQISQFFRCGEQWRCVQVYGPIPPAIAMIKGSAVHKAAEINFKQKIKSFMDLMRPDIVMAAVDDFEKRSSEDLFLSPDEKTVGKAKLIGEAKDAVAGIADVYATDMAPAIQPLKSELYIEKEIAGTTVKAYIDLIDDNKNIRDMKVTGRSKSQAEIDSSSQLTLYTVMVGEYSKLIIDNLVDKKKPEYKVFETTRTDEDYDRLIRRIDNMMKCIKAGVFPFPDEGSWMCSPRFCGYYGKCEYTKKGGFA